MAIEQRLQFVANVSANFTAAALHFRFNAISSSNYTLPRVFQRLKDFSRVHTHKHTLHLLVPRRRRRLQRFAHCLEHTDSKWLRDARVACTQQSAHKTKQRTRLLHFHTNRRDVFCKRASARGGLEQNDHTDTHITRTAKAKHAEFLHGSAKQSFATTRLHELQTRQTTMATTNTNFHSHRRARTN